VDGTILIPVGSNDEKMQVLKQKLAQIQGVEEVTACFAAPSSENRWFTSLRFDNRSEDEAFSVGFRGGDENFISTFGIDLVAGRNITPSDTVREFLVNETFARKLNLSPDEILGHTMRVNRRWTGPVVGVIKDFHDLSLHSDISPVFVTTSSEDFQSFGIRIQMQNSKSTLAAIEKAWTDIHPDLMYSYDFVDDLTARFYQTEETMLQLIQVFSFIALFIGCMGLYGLVSFMALQKTKEIGIRKVLGGNVSQILWIFGKEFSRLVVIAFVLAAPIGWFVMSGWLERFAYHITLTPWIFAGEFAVIISVVMLTVGYKAARSALMNPVKALRTE
jgi:putative ABC transport system permease protein